MKRRHYLLNLAILSVLIISSVEGKKVEENEIDKSNEQVTGQNEGNLSKFGIRILHLEALRVYIFEFLIIILPRSNECFL